MLASRGVRLIGDLTTLSPDAMRWSGKGGADVAAAARGEDDRPVETERDQAKSYSQQETFAADLADRGEVERIAKGMVDDLDAEDPGGREARPHAHRESALPGLQPREPSPQPRGGERTSWRRLFTRGSAPCFGRRGRGAVRCAWSASASPT
jgi:hypothetical protein